MDISRNPELERFFPGLSRTSYEITSPQTASYNCIAWAGEDDSRWWEPDPFGMYFWPEDAPREFTVDAYVSAFHQLGFVVLDDAPPTEHDCIAIYVKDSLPTHASRRLPSGRWTSKCGGMEDITHDLNALEGDFYGRVSVFLAKTAEE